MGVVVGMGSLTKILYCWRLNDLYFNSLNVLIFYSFNVFSYSGISVHK